MLPLPQNKKTILENLMEKMYCPWRQVYSALTHDRPAYTTATCIFCAIIQHPEDDSRNFVIKRLNNCAVMLNLYPYNAGHMMIVPYRHTDTVLELTPAEQTETMAALSEAIGWLTTVSKPDGFNIGLNLGKAAGAGIPEHVHWHVLPRWQGDTNFMPLLANTKQISFDLKELYQKFREVSS